MKFNLSPSDINQTFVVEPLSLTGGSPTISACTALYTNEIIRTNEGGEGKRCPLSVVSIKQKASYQMKGRHPTEKSIDLYKFLIERYSDVGDTVFDPTFGSCNSGLASIELKRNYVGIEKDNNFYWKAVNKII